MNTLDISIDPSIGVHAVSALPASVATLDWMRIVDKIPENYLLTYNIRGQVFSSGPANIVTVFVDCFNEMNLFFARQNHTMMMGGYSVLRVEFHDDDAQDSVFDLGGVWKVLGKKQALDNQAKFARATQSIWNFISFKIQN